jgi:hypothetical protein
MPRLKKKASILKDANLQNQHIRIISDLPTETPRIRKTWDDMFQVVKDIQGQ